MTAREDEQGHLRQLARDRQAHQEFVDASLKVALFLAGGVCGWFLHSYFQSLFHHWL